MLYGPRELDQGATGLIGYLARNEDAGGLLTSRPPRHHRAFELLRPILPVRLGCQRRLLERDELIVRGQRRMLRKTALASQQPVGGIELRRKALETPAIPLGVVNEHSEEEALVTQHMDREPPQG